MKDYWPTDGTQHHEIDRKRLYTNSSIDNFLDNESLWVIIASKGMGKTLLLRTKRAVLSRKTEGSVIIPENEEYDIPKLQASVPTYGYEDIDVWENIWKSSIVFSIFNYNHSIQKLDAKEIFWDYLEELEIDSNFKKNVK